MNKWLRKTLIGLCCICMGAAVGLTAACTDEEESSLTSETESSVSMDDSDTSEGSDGSESSNSTSEENGSSSSEDNDESTSEENNGSSSEDTEPCEHVWATEGEIITPATCMEDGVKQYLCTLCGDGKTESIAALNHNYSSQIVTATCQEQGYTLHTCANCQDEYKDTYTPTVAHSYATTIVAPTCVAQGYTLYDCVNCDDSHKDEYVAAVGHSYTQTASVAAGCTTKGYVTYTCNCGDHYDVEAPALGHNTVGCTWTKLPDLVQVSGCEYNEVFTTTCHTCSGTVEKTETVYKHAYTAKITLPATCMESGVKTFTCGSCNDSYNEDYEDSSAHNFVAQASTFGSSGVVSYACECGESKTAYSAKDNEGATVPNDAVQSGAEIELKNATMALDEGLRNQLNGADVSLSATTQSAPANMSQADKDRLGDNPVYNFTMEHGGAPVTDFNGAKMTITVPYTLGENEDPDEIAVWYINDEGVATAIPAVYSNGTATFETTHFSFYSVVRLTPEERCAIYTHMTRERVVEATCETDGYTLTYCIRCGHNEQSNAVEAFGHNYQATVTPATCTAQGYTTHVCNNCNDRYVDTYVNAFGHNYVDTVKAPTCITKGYTVHTCDTCDDTYTDSYLAVTAHTYASTVIAPTCTEKGYTKYSCTVCNKAYSGEFTDAIGHDYAVTGLCNNCGKMNPLFEVITEDNYYLHLFESLLDIESFYFTLEDFTYELKHFTGDELTRNEYTAIELAYFAFRPDGNGYFVGGGEGTFTHHYEHNHTVENYTGTSYLLLEDGRMYMYIVMDQGMDIPYEMVMDMSQDEMFIEMFGTSLEEMNETMNALPMMLEQLGLDNLVDVLKNVKDEHSVEINLALKAIIEYVFAKTPVDGGYDYTFNCDRILDIYDVLYGSSVIEVVDIVFGDGTYDSVYDYVFSSLNKTVREVETELDVVLTLYGGSIDDLYTLLESVFVAQGEDVDFATEIANFYSYTVSEMLDMMMGAEEAQDYAAMLSELNAMLSEMTIIDLLASMDFGGSNSGDMQTSASEEIGVIPDYDESLNEDMEEEARPIVKPKKQFASNEGVDEMRAMLEEVVGILKDIDFGFTANKRGELTSLYLNFPEMLVGESHTYGDSYENGYSAPIESTTTHTVGFNFNVSFNTEMPTFSTMAKDKAALNRVDFDFDAIIASKAPGSLGDARVGEVVDGKAYIASGMSSYNGDIYSWIENGKFSYEMLGQDTLNGETVEKYLITTGFVVKVFDIENLAYQMQTSCKDVVQYHLFGEGWYPNAQFYVWATPKGLILKEELIVDTSMQLQTGAYYEQDLWGESYGSGVQISTYYNTVTGKFFYAYSDQIHNYQEVERQDPVECGSKGYVKYVCSLCGNGYTETLYNNHEITGGYVLVEGATSCMQGVQHAYFCNKCGYIESISANIEYDHCTFTHYELADTTDCGNIYITQYKCACGQKCDDVSIRYNGCSFEGFVSEDKFGNGTPTKYTCYYCGYSYTYQFQSSYENCTRTVVYTYKFDVDDAGNSNNVKTYTQIEKMHKNTVTDYYPDENGNEVRFEECLQCGEVVMHEAYKNDAYGRRIFYVDYLNAIGTETVYDANCNFVRYNLIVNGMDVTRGEEMAHGTGHIWSTYYRLVEGATSCTQGVYRIEGCRACGAEEIYDTFYYHETYHQYYVVPSDCGGVEVEWYGCACGEYVDNIWMRNFDSCIFDFISDTYIDDAVRLNWWQEERRCPVKNHGENGPVCDLTYTYDRYYVRGTGCEVVHYYTYTFYTSSAKSQVLFTITEKDYSTMHDAYSTVVELGNGVREITWRCRNCNDYGYIEQIDRYGRVIYHSYDLQRTNGWRKVIDENCYYVEYYFYMKDGHYIEDRGNEGIEHANSWWYKHYLESSCTQYNLYYHYCEACNLYEYNEYGRPTEHYFEYDYELRHYVCSTCGLESNSDANGLFIMEDLTGRDGSSTLKAGFYNKYGIDEYDFDFAIVINYADNGVGTEVLYSSRGEDEVSNDLFHYMTYGQTGLITFNMETLNEAIEDYKAVYGDVDVEITISFSIYQRSTQTYIDHILTLN